MFGLQQMGCKKAWQIMSIVLMYKPRTDTHYFLSNPTNPIGEALEISHDHVGQPGIDCWMMRKYTNMDTQRVWFRQLQIPTARYMHKVNLDHPASIESPDNCSHTADLR